MDSLVFVIFRSAFFECRYQFFFPLEIHWHLPEFGSSLFSME